MFYGYSAILFIESLLFKDYSNMTSDQATVQFSLEGVEIGGQMRNSA